jgi:hypothetical protein
MNTTETQRQFIDPLAELMSKPARTPIVQARAHRRRPDPQHNKSKEEHHRRVVR